jgi:hypothetical protein
MSFIRGTDPLALLSLQAGETPTPSRQSGADGSNPLDVQQQAHKIGDPVPIVFGRRRNGAGGIFISPKATECRFENDETNAVTAYYHLVLSEGRIGGIEARHVFQRMCRVGSASQAYGVRSGTWIPENVITALEGFAKPEATYYCGSVGAYTDISTMSFQVTIPNGFDVWNRQVHVFVANGMEVKRWLDDEAAASSDSFADLAYWAMERSGRVPLELIDTNSIFITSRFLSANNFTTNCWLKDSINYSDLLNTWGRYHLVRPATINGKQALKPLLPVNTDGTIRTEALTVEYVFNDNLVIPGSVDIKYSDWSSRQPFVAQMVWRQELETCIGIIRTSEVRYAGTAANGPYESHDMSAFCTREDHAVKVGAYILSKRVRSSHTIRFKVRPQSHNRLIEQGSVVRVRLERSASGSVGTFHDYIYQVERITKTLAGDVHYECSHLPVDSQLRSLIAKDVASAQATGYLYPCNQTGTGCDLNPPDDTDPIPPDPFPNPPPIGGPGLPDPIPPGPDPIDVPPPPPPPPPTTDDDGPGGGGGGGGGSGGDLPAPDPNPNDGGDPQPVGPMEQCPVAGGAPGTPPSGICFGATVTRIIGNIGDEGNAIRETGGAELYSLPFTPPEPLGGDDYNGKFVVYEWECPDGSKQRSDPCEEPEQERDPNGDFTPNENILFTTNVASTYVITDCISGTTEDRGEDSSRAITLFAGSSYKVEGYGIRRTFEKRCTEAIPGPIGIAGATVTGPAGLVESVGGLVILPGGKDITFSRIINYTTANVNGDPVDLNDFRDP